MARLALVCLILAEILLVQAIAHKSETSALTPSGAKAETGSEPNGLLAPLADQPSSTSAESSDNNSNEAEAPAAIRRLGKHQSSDKSVAGGGVIIGGLVTAILAAVFAYIRVTRKRTAVHS